MERMAKENFLREIMSKWNIKEGQVGGRLVLMRVVLYMYVYENETEKTGNGTEDQYKGEHD